MEGHEGGKNFGGKVKGGWINDWLEIIHHQGGSVENHFYSPKTDCGTGTLKEGVKKGEHFFFFGPPSRMGGPFGGIGGVLFWGGEK